MTIEIDVLVIDDDKFIQKVIIKSLQSEVMNVRVAGTGELGIEEASNKKPDIIILDVEMPGINGFETCDRLRKIKSTQDVPIIFLSSHGSLRERMQGYEVGADDYLIKPFEKENLISRINILVNFNIERKELLEQSELANKNAITAMTASSELAIVMRFLEKILTYHSINDLAQGMFECIEQFSLDCCAMMTENDLPLWYSSENSAISPLEKEVLDISDKEARFLDFGTRTIINYPCVSLLVKNMPLDDVERYGRIKDLLPIILSSVNSKINAIHTEEALIEQSKNLLSSFKKIDSSLFLLGTTLVKNRTQSTSIMNQLVQDLNIDFLGMGLEEEQENLLLSKIDSAINKALEEMDAGKEIREALTDIRVNLNSVMEKQTTLYEAFMYSLTAEAVEQSADLDDGVELF
jgi:CheY-like chemotaxis protein